MSKALKAQVDQLFEATKDLESYDEIKVHCDRFNEWVNTHTNYSTKSLGTLLSRYGFYKKFKSIPLDQGLNAETVQKYDENGNVKGQELKHYAVLMCGLDRHDWKDRNETTRVISRLGNDQEIDPDTYLEVTGQLLESSDPHELAVGLIAATGRRPHEILARAKFAPIKGEAYQVQFEGQGKKRGDKPVFPIATLYPAEYIIKCHQNLRREAGTRALLKEVANEFPNDLAAQNQAIDSRRNGSLNRVVRSYFGNKGDESPALAFRHGEEQDNCKALRAAYGALATERDCQRSVGSKMLYYARLLGHFVKEEPTDKELQNVATSLGYADYFTSKPVSFPLAPEKEKIHQVRVFEEDFELIKQFQEKWDLPNQQSVINRLISSQPKLILQGRELVEAKETINQLQKEKAEMSQAQTQETNVVSPELEATIERIVTEKIREALADVMVTAQNKATSAPTRQAAEVIDWESKSNAELWGSKAKGASEEKVRRSFNAIALYNDTVATGDDDRLAITNQALRELSGVNGLLVGDWLKAHADEVISHNSKYGMQNAKDPTKTETYYNKRHGAEKITKILNLVNEQFLDGEALKSQQK
ncbi:MAG TPA: protelomerase family protein [Coleofasciculaceae cyanobacterium]|jgi:hypothetical protein